MVALTMSKVNEDFLQGCNLYMPRYTNGNFVPLPALFVQADPTAASPDKVVLDLHSDRSAHAREGVGDEGDERADPAASSLYRVDAIEQDERLERSL